jgi:hypothetical protein
MVSSLAKRCPLLLVGWLLLSECAGSACADFLDQTRDCWFSGSGQEAEFISEATSRTLAGLLRQQGFRGRWSAVQGRPFSAVPAPRVSGALVHVWTLIMPPPMMVPEVITKQNDPDPPPTTFTFAPPVQPPSFPSVPTLNNLPFISTFSSPPTEHSPEPTTWLLAVMGGSAVGVVRYVRKRRQK